MTKVLLNPQRTRKAWEDEMATDEEEVIMYSANGEVHEGISSNAFVVQASGAVTLKQHPPHTLYAERHYFHSAR